MLNLIISLAVSFVVNVLLVQFAGLAFWVASLISLGVFTLIYLVLTRLVMKKVAVLMETSQRELQANHAEKAVRTLQDGLKYGRWQFYVAGQVNSQIGCVYYLKRDFAKAFGYLQKGFVRHWVAMAMLAICYMKKNKNDKMIETFEKAVSGTRKEPLLWALYANCLDMSGQKKKAIAVLNKGLKKTSNDERLASGIAALEEGKKIKMQAFGDMWYQFHLEKPGALIKKQTKAMTGRRKMMVR